MTILLSQITPQRSTQYSQLASELAVPELRLSPLQKNLVELERLTLGGLEYVRAELRDALGTDDLFELGLLSMTNAHFDCFDELAGQKGPFLRPLETGYAPVMPREFVTARRYRGKTNELLTHFMCNVARFSSAFADTPWRELRVFDPLSGGGTTLFTALTLGAEAAGVEQNEQDVSSTAGYVREFCKEQRISFREQPERLRKLGKRWSFSLGKEPGRRCILAQGNTEDSATLISGFKPHLIVTDLPYGIQHQGKLAALLELALPVWMGLLAAGGCCVYAWDATRFPRDEMAALAGGAASGRVIDDGPYAELAHRVDRVIKVREVLVLRKN